MHQGGKVIGQNTLHMFGTPPSCYCAQENIPISSNVGHVLSTINNNYMNHQYNGSNMFSNQMTQMLQAQG